MNPAIIAIGQLADAVLTAISRVASTSVISEITLPRLQPAFDSGLSIDTINGQAQFGPSVGHLFCLSRSFCSCHSMSGILTPGWASVVAEYCYTVSRVEWRPTQKLLADSGSQRSQAATFPWSVWMGGFWSIRGSSCCN